MHRTVSGQADLRHPGHSGVHRARLIERLQEQIKPFNPGYHLGQEVTEVTARADGRFDVATSRGTRFDAGAVIIAGGVGSFQPRRLSVEGSDRHEGHSVHYRVKDAATFHDKDLVILGGGDSALDWTIELIERARSVVLVHRRAEFRGAPASVERMLALVEEGRLDFIEGQVHSIVEQDGKLTGVRVTARDGVTRTVATDQVLVFWGLSPKLGPIAEWGLTIHRRTIAVDTHRFQTNIPGIYAVGDINDYPGKKKLILSGFHEAALAAFAVKEHMRPGEKIHLQYTTTSPAAAETPRRERRDRRQRHRRLRRPPQRLKPARRRGRPRDHPGTCRLS